MHSSSIVKLRLMRSGSNVSSKDFCPSVCVVGFYLGADVVTRCVFF